MGIGEAQRGWSAKAKPEPRPGPVYESILFVREGREGHLHCGGCGALYLNCHVLCSKMALYPG